MISDAVSPSFIDRGNYRLFPLSVGIRETERVSQAQRVTDIKQISSSNSYETKSKKLFIVLTDLTNSKSPKNNGSFQCLC
jgi:hypothetical protein